MDIPTSAAPHGKTPPPTEVLATHQKEKSNASGPLELSADELHQLVSELQKMQEFLRSEVVTVQRQIDNAVAGINVIVETIGPWKGLASSFRVPSGPRNAPRGGASGQY